MYFTFQPLSLPIAFNKRCLKTLLISSYKILNMFCVLKLCIYTHLFHHNLFISPPWTLNAFRYDKRRPPYCYQCNEPNILVEITAPNSLSTTSCADKHSVEKSTIFESTRENADVAVLTVLHQSQGNCFETSKSMSCIFHPSKKLYLTVKINVL